MISKHVENENRFLTNLNLWLRFDEDLKMRAKSKPVYKSSFLKVWSIKELYCDVTVIGMILHTVEQGE